MKRRLLTSKTKYNEPGIYQLVICSRKNNRPILIGRHLQFDDKGILVIGTTKNIETRREQLFQSCIRKKRGHSEGMTFALIGEKAKKLFKKKYGEYDTDYYLEFHFNLTDGNIGKAKKLEEKQLHVYLKKHGELPPLNGALPGRLEEWERIFKNPKRKKASR